MIFSRLIHPPESDIIGLDGVNSCTKAVNKRYEAKSRHKATLMLSLWMHPVHPSCLFHFGDERPPSSLAKSKGYEPSA